MCPNGNFLFLHDSDCPIYVAHVYLIFAFQEKKKLFECFFIYLPIKDISRIIFIDKKKIMFDFCFFFNFSINRKDGSQNN